MAAWYVDGTRTSVVFGTAVVSGHATTNIYRIAAVPAGYVAVELSNWLSADFAEDLGLAPRDYAPGEQIIIETLRAHGLIGAGYCEVDPHDPDAVEAFLQAGQYSTSLWAANGAVVSGGALAIAVAEQLFTAVPPAGGFPPPAGATINISDVAGLQTALDALTAELDTLVGAGGSLTKASIGLGNVDNTSDANKPLSTAATAALALKLAKASNLSDLANVGTARTNLGLGSAAVRDESYFALAGGGGGGGGDMLKSDNLSGLANYATARTNLGLGTAATHPGGDFLLTASNLSDVASVATARTNLGLGTAATTATTAYEAAGTAALKASNLSDLASAATARTNLGLGTAATHPVADFLQSASNLSDLASAATARTNLGLGGAAVLAVGTTAGTVAAGDDSRFGSGGSPAASSVTYDPATSAGFQEENSLVEGMPVLQSVVATDLQEAVDYLNRFAYASDHAWYLLGQRDSLRRVYPLVGAAPSTTTGEQIPGIAPLGASRTVPLANLATGAADGTKFLRGDGTWASPTAVATRQWVAEAADRNLRAMNADPHPFGVTNTSLAASTCYAIKVWIPVCTVTNYLVHCQTVGVTLAANLYAFSLHYADATGTLVTGSGTADAASVWLTTGIRSIALGTPFVNATAGWFYVLVQAGTATTQPKPSTVGTAIANAGCTVGSAVAPNAAGAPLYAVPVNSFTGLTPPATTGNVNFTGAALAFWVGLS